jgi:hypothetical protein
MPTVAKKGADRELTPSGTHVARCIKFMHFGHVKEVNFHGQEQYIDKCRLTWELPLELRVFDEDKGEQPMSISKDYTLSLGEKANLRKDLESWRGKSFTPDELSGFDVETIVGVPCLVNIIHTQSKSGSMYAKIASVTPLMKGTECPEQINPSFIWNYNDNFDLQILENLHEWFQDKIKGSLEYKEAINPDPDDSDFPTIDEAPEQEPENDLPF